MYMRFTYLDEEALYGPDDPPFPATAIAPQSNTGFAVEGFDWRPWKTGAGLERPETGPA